MFPPVLYVEMPALLNPDATLVPGVVEQVHNWVLGNGVAAGFNFWPGILEGTVDPDQAAIVDRTLASMFNGDISMVLWCMHSPDLPDPLLSKCACAKPHPGLLYRCEFELSKTFGPVSHPGSLVVGLDGDTERMADAFNADFALVHDWVAGC